MPKIGLDVKTKHAEELTETVEVVEEVDEEEAIQNEVGATITHAVFVDSRRHCSSNVLTTRQQLVLNANDGRPTS